MKTIQTGSAELLAELAYAYTGAGSKENALRIVEMMDGNSSNLHVGIGARAMAMLAIGKYSEALELLREAGMDIINGGDIDGGFTLHVILEYLFSEWYGSCVPVSLCLMGGSC
jgi:hypothetical protein